MQSLENGCAEYEHASFAEKCQRFLQGEPLHSVWNATRPVRKEEVSLSLTSTNVADNVYDLENKLKMHVKTRSPDAELVQAAMRGDLRRTKRALTAKADIESKNPRGHTPLMLASTSSSIEQMDVLKVLLQSRTDINAKDGAGWTPLHHACRNGKIEVAKVLVSVRADISQATSDAKTSLMLATLEAKSELVRELLKLPRGKESLQEKCSQGWTALHYGAKCGSTDIIRQLLESNAKVNAKDIEGRVPLMIAAEHGSHEGSKMLLRRSTDINVKDKTGRTALFFSCLSSYEGLSLWLLKKQADPQYRDVSGDTPMKIAEDLGLFELRKAVRERSKELERLELEAANATGTGADGGTTTPGGTTLK